MQFESLEVLCPKSRKTINEGGYILGCPQYKELIDPIAMCGWQTKTLKLCQVTMQSNGEKSCQILEDTDSWYLRNGLCLRLEPEGFVRFFSLEKKKRLDFWYLVDLGSKSPNWAGFWYLVDLGSKSPNWGCSPSKWPKWLINGGY